MQKQRLTLVERILHLLLRLFQKRAAIRVYTNITRPGSGTRLDPGQHTIRIEFGTSVADIIYCLKIFQAPDYNTPINSIPLPLNSTTYELTITIAENTSYMFRIVPCDPGDLLVTAGSVGITSASIE